ncbi:MAG TPA: ADOP family duplicated permease [Bryobacteraceae bacterium]|nr:ADOP family duplicated permease [Bryobacteraceae bacterium]
MGLLRRIRNVFMQDRLRREVDEELADHLACAFEAGRSREEATRALGSPLRHREASLDARLWTILDSLGADAVFVWRQLRRRPAVTAAAVASLAMAIGSATTGFLLVDAVLLRPLPVRAPHELQVAVYTRADRNGMPDEDDTFSYPQFRELRETAGSKAELAAVSYPAPVDLVVGAAADTEKAQRQFVSGNYFGMLGLQPTLGRLLGPDDDRTPGGHPVAVLSHDYWRRRFGGGAGALGSTVRFHDVVYTVVGVAPHGFTGTDPGTRIDVFFPVIQNVRTLGNRGWGWLRLLARVRPDTPLETLRASLDARYKRSGAEWVAKWPAWGLQKQKDMVLRSEIRLHSAAAGVSRAQRHYRQPLWILSGVALLVLLIACANVANLLAAQADARRRELAVRVSLGAGAGRLVQMVLVECLALGAAATVTGAALAAWMTPQVVQMLQLPQDPLQLDVAPGLRALLFSAVLASSITVLLALAPALRAHGVQPAAALKGEGALGRRRLMYVLAAVQVAFCVGVYFVTGLFLATLEAVTRQPAGFQANGVLLLETYVRGGERASLPIAAWREAEAALRNVPGVQSASLAGWGLFSGNVWSDEIQLAEGVTADTIPYFLAVDSGWIQTMQVALLAGRDLDRYDRAPGVDGKGKGLARQVIVNQAFARQYFQGQNPVGRQFFKPALRRAPSLCTVVGYVADFRYRDLREANRPTVLVPFEQGGEATFVVRAPETAAPALRAALRKSNPELFVTSVTGQEELVRQQTVRERLLAKLSAFFSAAALVLAAVGLYGVLHYTVLLRRREIGIRLALGAGRGSISLLVGTEMLLMVAVGACAGLAAGLASERLLSALLFGVNAQDPRVIAWPLTVVALTAVCAAAPPILSALRIDPAAILRCE